MPNQKQPTNLQEAAGVQNQQLLEGARSAITALHAAVVLNQVYSVLPEPVFKEYFLDFFMYPANHQNSPLLAKWIELAGGPYNPVNIIDARGNVLFTAPSALLNVTMDYDTLNSFNFAAVASTYNMKKRITEAQAANYITSILGSVNKNVHADVQTHIMRWVSIFSRYATVDKPEVLVVQKLPKNAPDLGIFDI